MDNVIADALSRDKAHLACSLLQGAERMPVEVPKEVLDVVARTKPELEEVDWEKLWNFFSREGWQNPPRGPTQ